MKVRELIAKLAILDQDIEVYCYTEDKRFATRERPFWLLDIHHVETVNAELSRDENHLPVTTFDNSPSARTIATLDATSDF
jgi:hypothetical protein